MEYQKLSIKLVKEEHPTWSAAKLEAEAEKRFNAAALEFFVQSLRTGRAMRPKAKWGYYGYFYSDQYPRALWEAMSMLNPQLYMYGDGPSNSSEVHATRRQGIANTVATAVNISRQLEADGLPRPAVLPVAWQYYPSGGPRLDRSDLASELLEPYNAGADGLILWGDDPENADYWSFVSNTSGPMLKDFIDKAEECAESRCSGHGRCTYVPVEPLFTCSADNKCVAAGSGGEGVPQHECEQACGPDDKSLYRCVDGSCVPSLQGVARAECAKMCSHEREDAWEPQPPACECRPPWEGDSCAHKAGA